MMNSFCKHLNSSPQIQSVLPKWSIYIRFYSEGKFRTARNVNKKTADPQHLPKKKKIIHAKTTTAAGGIIITKRVRYFWSLCATGGSEGRDQRW